VYEEPARHVARRQDERCPDRLLAEELVLDARLHPPHDVLPQHPYHRGVHAGRHDPERVAGGDEGVMRLQFLKP
jgi:hypothetical protein